MTLEWSQRRRLPWVLLALALMFASAYFAALWIGSVGSISGWVGLPAYAAALEQVKREAEWWKRLALALPFAAAFVLGLGTRSAAKSDVATREGSSVELRSWILFIQGYALRLVVSALGAFGFLLILFLVGTILYKLGIHSG